MRHWRQALEDHYPDLARRLAQFEGEIGNRGVDVAEVLVRASEEAPRLRALLEAGFADLREALEDYAGSGPDPSPSARFVLSQRLAASLTGAVIVGLWLAQTGLGEVSESLVRRRLRALTVSDDAMQRARGAESEGDAP